MSESKDVLSDEVIRSLLNHDNETVVLSEIDSTNEEIKRRVRDGKKKDLVIISDMQTGGKGRRGRDFFSPAGTGIYMSILFCPDDKNASDLILITTAAAVAVAHAIGEVCGKDTKIKWVNDVYLNDRKICGILTESVNDPETGRIKYVICGIGINVKKPKEIPDDIKDIIGYIYDDTNDTNASRNEIAAAVINQLQLYYDRLPDRSFLKEYKERSMVIGKSILFGSPGKIAGVPGDDWEKAKAVDIDDEGGLVVECIDGSVRTLHTGEITLRLDS